MHELFHIIGLCPDNLAHLDILDILMVNYQEFTNALLDIVSKIKKFGFQN